MTTLKEIRKRINSVEHVKQITKSMEMVAAARLQKAHAKAQQANQYVFLMKEMMGHVILSSTQPLHPLFQEREMRKIGVVVVGSDRGLCGPYNSNVFTATDDFLNDYPPDAVELTLFGKKAIDFYKHKPLHIANSISDWGEKMTFQMIKEVTNELLDSFLSGKLDAVWIIYTHYITTFSRKVIVEKFLNIEISQKKEKNPAQTWIFEPNVPELLEALLPRYTLAKMQFVLKESYAAELAARVCSMRAATTNAEEMIEKLTLIRNKVRQASITKEILEISSSAEGVKQLTQ